MRLHPVRTGKVLVLICISALIFLSSCQGAGPAAQKGSSKVPKGHDTTLLLNLKGRTPLPIATATPTPTPLPTPTATASSAPPVSVPSGTGGLPAAFPRYLSMGVANVAGAVADIDTMRQTNGTKFTFRYQALAGGVNTGKGWETWNQPAGQYAINYMQESDKSGYIPTFPYYELCQSNGVHDGSYCGGHDSEQDPANVNNPSVMNAYFANWALLMQKIHEFGKPVLVIVEPDLWGFLEHVASNDDAASVPASVSSSGYAPVAGYPNTVQGFAWALLHLRDLNGSNAILAIHASLWGAGGDIAASTQVDLDVNGLAQKTARFLGSAGLAGNPQGVSTWDLLSDDVSDHDAGQIANSVWWDRYNRTFPNFARYLDFIGKLSQATQRRVVMWQVPLGNQYFTAMNNAQGHYQDNRIEYILSNPASFAQAGVVAVLFGPGSGGTYYMDAVHDGITNPDPISTYECDHCNTHSSTYADDDGGFLRLFVAQYMQNPVAIQ